MIQLSDYVKIIAVSTLATAMVIGLGGCGNTVKGIGTDIVKIGEKWSEPDDKAPSSVSVEETNEDVQMYEPEKKKGQEL